MNKLHPQLKQVLEVVEEIERSSISNCETPPHFAQRIVTRVFDTPTVPQSALLELMVRRGAAFAALIGLVMLTIQLSFAKPSLGILKDVAGPCTVRFRIILP